jgi:hypothetical protein
MRFINNKKGSTTIAFFFSIIIFIILWVLVFAKMLTDWGNLLVIQNNLTGVLALIGNNLNFVVGLCLVLSIMLVVRYGGSQ